MTFRELSTDFPTIEKVNYLSTASIGLVPSVVIEKSTELFKDLAQGGTLALNEEKEVMIYDSLRNEGALLLNCDSKDIAVFNSVSEAFNAIAWSLKLERGKIISTRVEFPSVTYPWLRLASKNNLDIKLLEGKDWCISSGELINEIDEQTKVVALSHVSYLSGQKYDLAQITKSAHDVGALVIFDGIQATGYTPIDVRKWGVDVYITGSYKWLCAPFGTAIAYIAKNLNEELKPALVGWRSVEEMWDFNAVNLNFASTARKFEYSTSAYGVKIGFAESIKYLRQIGIENISSHNTKLVELLLTELATIDEINIISPKVRGSIVAFRLNVKRNLKHISERLRELKRPIEFTVRQNMVRISPHIYNTEEDIMNFVNSLKQTL
ncbi:MAG: aminotransferase class V-fold PLP-dependent enzyme [Candidatus Hodarchaeota archaeon]